MIYFIATEDMEYVKIGIASEPINRLKTLQVGSWQKLILVSAFDLPNEYESRFHNAFSLDRMSGEWFRFNQEIKELLANKHGGQDDVTDLLVNYLKNKEQKKQDRSEHLEKKRQARLKRLEQERQTQTDGLKAQIHEALKLEARLKRKINRQAEKIKTLKKEIQTLRSQIKSKDSKADAESEAAYMDMVWSGQTNYHRNLRKKSR